MLERMAEERRSRRETAPEAPAGQQWGTCVGVHEVGDRRRKMARVLLASGMVITAYLPLNAAAPAIDAPVLVQTRAIGDRPPDDSVVVSAIGDQPGHGEIVAD
jgi:ribosomal protein S12